MYPVLVDMVRRSVSKSSEPHRSLQARYAFASALEFRSDGVIAIRLVRERPHVRAPGRVGLGNRLIETTLRRYQCRL